jgi:hypothetical protein
VSYVSIKHKAGILPPVWYTTEAGSAPTPPLGKWRVYADNSGANDQIQFIGFCSDQVKISHGVEIQKKLMRVRLDCRILSAIPELPGWEDWRAWVFATEGKP